MAKAVKAHINLKTPGEYDFLTSIAFEHDQSEYLRLTEIRLRSSRDQKPYKLALNLLSWYTDYAPAGREITREENNQQSLANLYIDMSLLREQLDTYALKSPFLLEIDVSELDRNDEGLMRRDKGIIHIEVNLYHGPKASCHLTLENLGAIAQSPALDPGSQPIAHSFPINCQAQSRFDLANSVLKSDEGPLDPRTDKRVLIANITLEAPFQSLRTDLIERLTLFNETARQPGAYVRDAHQYEELYNNHPWDQSLAFPDGCQVFGPLLPQAPKEKDKPLIISLNAPPTDPFWSELKRLQNAHQAKPLLGTLHLTLPEPGVNMSHALPFQIRMETTPWLIITEATGRSAPVLISLKDEDKSANQTEAKQNVTLTLPSSKAQTLQSELLSIQQYNPLSQHEEPANQLLNLALNPPKKDATTHIIRPEVLEITDQDIHMVLLNPVPNIKQQNKTEFKIKCVWPDTGRTLTHKLTIKWEKPRFSQSFSIDIGSKYIAMAKRNDQISTPIKLASFASQLNGATQKGRAAYFLPSTLALSTSIKKEAEEQSSLNDQNWHAQSYPLSISYECLPWMKDQLQKRLEKQQRHFDFGLPSHAAVPEQSAEENEGLQLSTSAKQSNLKRLFAHGKQQSTLQKDEYYITHQQAKNLNETTKTGLTKSINIDDLMTDCISELIGFYGTYLPRITAKESLSVEEKNAQTSLAQEGATLILTHPDSLTNTGQHRYRKAATKALTAFEHGSFSQLNEAAELVGLKSQDEIGQNIHLVPETFAGAYQSLYDLAQKEQPARPQNVQLIHMDIGSASANLSTFTGCIGETKALLNHHCGSLSLPLGGQCQELVLVNEISQILEAALAAGAPLIPQASLPISQEAYQAARTLLPETTTSTQSQLIQNQFLSNLSAALLRCSAAKPAETNDLKICLAKSTGENWLFSLSTTYAIDNTPVTIWQGLQEEKIILEANEDKTQWRLELHCSTQKLQQKVGPLSTYLAFLTDFLPNVLAATLPPARKSEKRLLSLSGGPALLPGLQQHLQHNAKKMGFELLTPPQTYDEAKLALVNGALGLITHQTKTPQSMVKPSLLLIHQDQDQPSQQELMSLLGNNKFSIISTNDAQGEIPKKCTSLQLIETVPGLAKLVEKHSRALLARTYMDDLDHAKKEQWTKAEHQWQIWLRQCYQTSLNMAVPLANADKNAGHTQNWHYQSLQDHEAQLSIGEQSYWISSGLIHTES